MSGRAQRYYLILIVEPDDAALCAMVRTLREAGHQTIGVASYLEAKRQIKLDRIDVLITQTRLGAFNGLQLVLLARAENPRLQALLLHDQPDPFTEREAISAGAAFLVSPIPGDSLLAVINMLVVTPDSLM